MGNLSDVKAGDEALLRRNGVGGIYYEPVTITRATKTLLYIGSIAYSRVDGYRIGWIDHPAEPWRVAAPQLVPVAAIIEGEDDHACDVDSR